jgi:hypothetical protein
MPDHGRIQRAREGKTVDRLVGGEGNGKLPDALSSACPSQYFVRNESTFLLVQ